ncbi:MAG: molybdopterin converting factor subunit 1 [Hyphomicrobiales bacterium]|nr:molybdopterin converting factor subunit 1 [Hyphomicrobiales bacterium]
MRLVYFAWVRERIGRASEDIDLPADVRSVDDVIDFLVARGDDYAHAFAARKSIRAALDKAHVSSSTPIAGARELAFFPPMTGG